MSPHEKATARPPMPWSVGSSQSGKLVTLCDAHRFVFMTLDAGPWALEEFRDKTAHLIVTAVNSHAALVEALQTIQSIADMAKDNPKRQTSACFDILDEAREALRLAQTIQGGKL